MIYAETGVERAEYLGSDVTGLGDVDDDGLADFAVSSAHEVRLYFSRGF